MVYEYKCQTKIFDLQLLTLDLKTVMANLANTYCKNIFITVVVVVGFMSTAICQSAAIGDYKLNINVVDKDSLFNQNTLGLKTGFVNMPQCAAYINQLAALLNTKGYMAASVDKTEFDSNFANIALYLGQQQKWVTLNTDSVEKNALDESGYFARKFLYKPVDFNQAAILKERLLGYYEKNGYPFAAVYFDDYRIDSNTLQAALKVNKGPIYHLDSIRVYGKIKISNSFLQRYLGTPNGSLYNREKLEQVSKRLLELPYLQEQQSSDVTMLGTGSILNLYLQPKRSSQVNFLIGFLPANNQTNQLQLTGDVNLNLKNSLGNGETILLNWQQLQLHSPRLNIGYQQPYIFKSPFGLDFSFELFKKDSTFLQLNAQFGIQYLFAGNQSGKLFFQQQSTSLLGAGVDTNQVKLNKKLPANIDVKATNIGVDYEWNKTNYRFNPQSGNEIKILASAGLKTIAKNNDILSLTNNEFNYGSLYDSIKLKTYQVRIKINAAHYFPVGKAVTLKTQLNAGIYSSQTIFKNDLFQIGGYKLLRGFDEESIFATRYAVFTAELRYLAGQNSYLFAFADGGGVKTNYQSVNKNNTFISTGIGMVFETKLGLLNMSFAIGKRDDVPFDLRRAAKIHFGYINYF